MLLTGHVKPLLTNLTEYAHAGVDGGNDHIIIALIIGEWIHAPPHYALQLLIDKSAYSDKSQVQINLCNV